MVKDDYIENAILSATWPTSSRSLQSFQYKSIFPCRPQMTHMCTWDIHLLIPWGSGGRLGMESFLAAALQPWAITFVHHSVLSKYCLCVKVGETLLYRVQIKPLYNTIKGFIYMYQTIHIHKHTYMCIHTYTQAVLLWMQYGI